MALSLLIDLLANTAQFDSAFDKSEKRIKAFAREANQAGQAAGKIGNALRVADVAGLDKIAAGSQVARVAIGGVTGALTLLGSVPVPLVLGAVGVGALIAWATSADTAAEKAANLQERIDKLLMSQKAAAVAPMRAVAAEIGAAIDELQAKVQSAQQKLGSLPASDQRDGGQSSFLKRALDENQRIVAEGTTALEQKRKEYAQAIKKIAEVGKEFDGKGLVALNEFNTGLQRQVATMGQGAEAAARFELQHGKLAEALKNSGAEGERVKETILATARALDASTAATERAKQAEQQRSEYLREIAAAQDEVAAQEKEAFQHSQNLAQSIASFLNPALEAYKARLAEVDEALAKKSITESTAAEARKKAADDLQKANDKLANNKFADEAARNIHNITASLLKGAQSGREFGASIIGALRDIAAEIAAQQLLKALFGSFQGTGGVMGAFAGAVIGKRAAGGPVSAGKPYLVGERGPELIVPRAAGTVIPNNKLAGAGATFAPSITINGNGDSVEKLLPVLTRWLRGEQEVFVRRMARGQLSSAT